MQTYLFLLLGSFSLFTTTTFGSIKSEDEAFALRRIADFWEEGEYEIAKSQIEEFLSTYPQNEYSDVLKTCLGDLFLCEKNFRKALSSYASISSPELLKNAFSHRMQCLYHLEWHSTLADECEVYLQQETDAGVRKQAIFYLTIALYQQCLNAEKDPNALSHLAKRIEPYFETLCTTNLSHEMTYAFAHLCSILKEYKKAADIYLAFAQKNPQAAEEMIFQAALMQAEYDPIEALASLSQMAKKGGEKAQIAAYNCMVLTFQAQRYDELLQNRESILASIPEDTKKIAYHFFAQSCIQLQKYAQALQEFTAFFDNDFSIEDEWTHSALLSCIDASYKTGDLLALNEILAKLSATYPDDPQIFKGKWLHAQILQNMGRIDESRVELENLIALDIDFPERPSAHFALLEMEYAQEHWQQCRDKCQYFLKSFPTHECAPFAWRYLSVSSGHLAKESVENVQQFVQDLESLLEQKHLFPLEEVYDWQTHLALNYFNFGRFETAIDLLESPLSTDVSFSQKGNAYFILSLCYRDGEKQLAPFCKYAEMAIEYNETMMDTGQLHVGLFNAYLELAKESSLLLEKSASHLYAAFLTNAEIAKENLLWLGDWFFEKNPSHAVAIFSSLLQADCNETVSYKLAKLYSILGRMEESIALLDSLLHSYQKAPEGSWHWEKESILLMAEAYQSIDQAEKALELLDTLATGPIRSEAIAKAYLDKAQLYARNDTSNIEKIAPLLKTLMLQRRLEFEPIHLEAALEYLSVITKNSPEKRAHLLEKIKADFERTDDLLSADYHQSRIKFPEKSQIYESYMQYLKLETLLANGSDITELLQQMKKESLHPWLLQRITSRIQEIAVE